MIDVTDIYLCEPGTVIKSDHPAFSIAMALATYRGRDLPFKFVDSESVVKMHNHVNLFRGMRSGASFKIIIPDGHHESSKKLAARIRKNATMAKMRASINVRKNAVYCSCSRYAQVVDLKF